MPPKVKDEGGLQRFARKYAGGKMGLFVIKRGGSLFLLWVEEEKF